MLPDFNREGNLPEGVHPCGMEELINRFGERSARRKWLLKGLNEVISIAKSTGKLEQIYLWGSFISDKELPNDIDLLLVMNNEFSVDNLSESQEILFDYLAARVRFNADVFWTKSSVDSGAINLLLDAYQTTKDLKRRGIIELELK